MDGYILVYLYSRILQNNKNKISIATPNIGESHEQNFDWEEPDMKVYILYIL